MKTDPGLTLERALKNGQNPWWTVSDERDGVLGTRNKGLDQRWLVVVLNDPFDFADERIA